MRLALWVAASLLIAVGVVLLAPVDLRDRDFAGFWLGSRMVLEGRDPYDPAAWLPALRDIAPRFAQDVPDGAAYGYPLWTAVLTIPFALGPFELSSRLWLGAQIGLGLGTLVALLHALGARRPGESMLLVLALVLSEPWRALVEIGNVGGFLLAIVSATLLLLERGRPRAAGVVLGTALLKPHLFVLFVPVLLLSHRRELPRLMSGLAATAGVLVLASFVVLPGWPSGWLSTLARTSAGVGARATTWGLGGVGLALVAAALVSLVVWWRASSPAPMMLVAAALPLSLFVAPYAGNYDQIVLFAPVAICLSALSPAGPWRRALGWWLLLTIMVPFVWLLELLIPRGGGEAPGSLAPLALFFTVIVVDHLARSRRLPGVIVALAAILMWGSLTVWLALAGIPPRSGIAGAAWLGAVVLVLGAVVALARRRGTRAS